MTSEFFGTICCRSIRRAADTLGTSHSTAWRHLTDLETRWGATLFTRSRDGLLATHMAENTLVKAERVEDEIFRLEREATNLGFVLTGEVRITPAPPISQVLLMPHIEK